MDACFLHDNCGELGELEKLGNLTNVRLEFDKFDFLSLENFLRRNNIDYIDLRNYPL